MRDLFDLRTYNLKNTEVHFQTDDRALQEIFEKADALCKENVREFNDYNIMMEGAKYKGVWLETQPLGGEMYAKRNMEIALGNIMIFMRYQRRDGKMPGMISDRGEWLGITAQYDWMQGNFLTYPAFKMYYWLGEDKEYLKLLYDVLSAFDAYLWQYRDSTGNGVLENWSIWDVGEDNNTLHMLHGLKHPDHGKWGKSTPPTEWESLPHKSPQYMAYSYAQRDVLSKISEILQNGKAEMWREKALEVQKRARAHLWDDETDAFYVRDKDGKFIYALTQENIKCMYHNLMTQEMADTFISEHLLNKDEFFTPYPLPSVAANNPYFHVNKQYSNCAEKLAALGTASADIDDNSWSGPLHGLNWQRSIDALMNYNHHAETVLIGKKILSLLKREKKLIQNYNPFTGEPANGLDGYGPTMLSVLEYVSLLYGVNYSYGNLYWSACIEGVYEYTQVIGDMRYTLKCDGKKAEAYVNDVLQFAFSTGVRVLTDMYGNIQKVYFTDEKAHTFELKTATKEYKANGKPNESYVIENDLLTCSGAVPFDYVAE